MAKTKTQKELLAAVRTSTLAFNYDLTRVDPREYAAPIGALFLSETWKDMFIRRNKLFRAAQGGDANAFKQIEQIDRKVANMILQEMFRYSQQRMNQIDGRTVTLNEYFADFVRTQEQHELYEKFSLDLDSAMLLADILNSLLVDAKETLKKLDPALVLQEFDSIADATKKLAEFSYLHHRDENEELACMFADNAEEIEEYLRMKTAVFVKSFQQKRQSLIDNGKMTNKPVKKHSDREYLIDLLSNHFYHMMGGTKDHTVEAQQKARKAVEQFEDNEIEELMPVAVDLYRQSESIHMAKERLNTIVKTLPDTEVTKKIVKHVL